MTTYTWPLPTDKAFWPRAVRWRQITNGVATTSSISGYTQTGGTPGTRWAMQLDMDEQSFDERRRLGAFLARLEGAKHRISMFDPANPRPRGTIALSGITLSANAAQFAETIVLASCGAGATLLAHDWLVLAGQRLMCAADATANGSGIMTVEVRHQLRAAANSGAAVAVDYPRGKMMLNPAVELPLWAFQGAGRCPAFTFELVEDLAP